jgi:hypothetical protein
MKLTEQQQNFFKTFGFLKFPGLFADDIDQITNTFEKIFIDKGGGHHGGAHDFKQRSSIVPFIDQEPYFCALLDDPRIEEMASSIVGADFNYSNSDGNFYVGDTAWHSDIGHDWKYQTMKIAFYLDEVTRDTGCLRVIPGSHRADDAYASTLNDMMPGQRIFGTTDDSLGVAGENVPAYAIESTPGDLLIFDRRIKHASFGGSTRRRMFTIVLEQRSDEDDLPALRERIGTLSRWWMERAYSPTMIDTAGPGRMVHLEQRLANDGHLAELTRKAREEMPEPARG